MDVHNEAHHRTRMSVMTYNIRAGRGMDNAVDLVRTAEVIRGAGAELVALQEVDRFFSERSRYEDQLAVLAERLGMEAVYGANLTFPPEPGRNETRQYGTAILSRYPIRAWRNCPLTSGSEPRGVLLAEIEHTGGRLLTFGSTHWGLNGNERLEQAEETLRLADAAVKPFILAGDFNASPRSKEIQRLQGTLRSAMDGVQGDVYTFPAGAARETIDYIWVGEGAEVGAAEVIRSLASDHYALRAELYV